ncbi:MAG: POTRA domain-containing protein [Chitinophagaceae bacterium]
MRSIIIEGNRKTRPEIILREISFKPGDKLLLQHLVKRFEYARRQLMNTTLFHEVTVALKSFDGYDVDVLVVVRERWYIFPVPYFKPVDRNLNQWLFEQKASLTRVNYGAKVLWNNFSGRNDRLRFWLIGGYTKQLQFSYDRKYIDRKMKWGAGINLSTGNNKEINYNTIGDKQVFLKNDGNNVRRFTTASAQLSYRNAIKTIHRFNFGYTWEHLADTVAKLNPDYFKNGSNKIRFPEFSYNMTYLDLDYNPYPTRGYALDFMLTKKGISKSLNSWQASVQASGNWPTSKKTFFSLNLFGSVKVPFSQPYFNRRLLGYADVFMQGYEYYVVDGVAGGYLKASFTRKMLNFALNIPGTRKIAPQRIPINIYGRVYGNAGYIYNPDPGDNFLANKMLYSTGFGLDITSIYDFTLKIEWSFNQLGQNGIFLHRKTMF